MSNLSKTRHIDKNTLRTFAHKCSSHHKKRTENVFFLQSLSFFLNVKSKRSINVKNNLKFAAFCSLLKCTLLYHKLFAVKADFCNDWVDGVPDDIFFVSTPAVEKN